MAEAVDRLELVADHEEPRLGLRRASISASWTRFVSWNSSTIRCSKRARQASRPARASQQRERPQLEVLEVGPGALGLEALVGRS